MTRIIIGFEGYGATNDIRIGFHHLATIGKHAVGLVEMPLHVLIYIIGSLLDGHQDVVNVLLRARKGLLGVVANFIEQRLAREIEHYSH